MNPDDKPGAVLAAGGPISAIRLVCRDIIMDPTSMDEPQRVIM